MPNTNRAFGCKPLKTIDGTLPGMEYGKTTTTVNIIYKYAPLILNATGFLSPATANNVPVIGVAADFNATATAATIPYYPAKNWQFEVQCNTSGTIGQTHVGNNASLVFTAGDASNLSQAQIVSSSLATTNNLVRVVSIIDRPDVTPTGSFVKVAIVFNQHRWPSGAGQSGI